MDSRSHAWTPGVTGGGGGPRGPLGWTASARHLRAALPPSSGRQGRCNVGRHAALDDPHEPGCQRPGAAGQDEFSGEDAALAWTRGPHQRGPPGSADLPLRFTTRPREAMNCRLVRWDPNPRSAHAWRHLGALPGTSRRCVRRWRRRRCKSAGPLTPPALSTLPPAALLCPGGRRHSLVRSLPHKHPECVSRPSRPPPAPRSPAPKYPANRGPGRDVPIRSSAPDSVRRARAGLAANPDAAPHPSPPHKSPPGLAASQAVTRRPDGRRSARGEPSSAATGRTGPLS
jgi:hypothetical protein